MCPKVCLDMFVKRDMRYKQEVLARREITKVKEKKVITMLPFLSLPLSPPPLVS